MAVGEGSNKFLLGAIGRLLMPEPLPRELLYAEPLRRRMHVRFGGVLIAADCKNFLLLFEPGRYPVAYFPKGDISQNSYNAPSTPTCTTPTKRSEMARLLSVKTEAAEEDRDFVLGQYGEKFTIEGLPNDAVCIGDRYQIGSSLFEVTQPRVNCYRIGIRMNEPRQRWTMRIVDGRRRRLNTK